MSDKHLPLIVQFVHFVPAKMLGPPSSGKRTYPTVGDAEVKLGAPVILHRVRIHAVGLQSTGNRHKFIVDGSQLSARFPLLVQLHHLALKHIRLAQREPHILHVIVYVDCWVVVAQFLCGAYNVSRDNYNLIALSNSCTYNLIFIFCSQF